MWAVSERGRPAKKKKAPNTTSSLTCFGESEGRILNELTFLTNFWHIYYDPLFNILYGEFGRSWASRPHAYYIYYHSILERSTSAVRVLCNSPTGHILCYNAVFFTYGTPVESLNLVLKLFNLKFSSVTTRRHAPPKNHHVQCGRCVGGRGCVPAHSFREHSPHLQ
jgi:hypothetical protein